MNRETKLDVLDINWGISEEHEKDSFRITNGEFAEADALSDFDLIFLDPQRINQLWTEHLTPQPDGRFKTNPEKDGGLSSGLDNLMRARREELVNLLEKSGGALFCKLRKTGRELSVLNKGEKERFNRYSWLPDSENELFRNGQAIKTRKGTRLSPEEISSPVARFLIDTQDSISYEAVLKSQSLSEVETSEIFATTPSGNPVSFAFPRGEGSIIFLPAGMELEHSDEEKLLEAAEKVVSSGGYYRPSWIENYQFPAEKDIRKELNDIDRKVSQLEKQKKEKEKELTDIDILKGLLSARSDYELKSSLLRALEVAGLEVTDGGSGIDLIVTDSEKVNLAITVGANSEGPVGLDPYHRLVKGINELKIFENKDPQGVVVGNGFGAEDPGDREGQLKEELIEGCNLYGFTVVTAKEIFARIKEIKQGKVGSREGLIQLFENG